jgi:hypothetical protein
VELSYCHTSPESNGTRWRTKRGKQRVWRPVEDKQLISDLHALQEEGRKLGLDYRTWALKPGEPATRLGFDGAEHLERLKYEPE